MQGKKLEICWHLLYTLKIDRSDAYNRGRRVFHGKVDSSGQRWRSTMYDLWAFAEYYGANLANPAAQGQAIDDAIQRNSTHVHLASLKTSVCQPR